MILIPHDKDRYGRTVGELFSGKRSINLDMVAAGQAAVYRKYCQDGDYLRAERIARRSGTGVWSKTGDQHRPWVYRNRE